jgi:hypothetical protein
LSATPGNPLHGRDEGDCALNYYRWQSGMVTWEAQFERRADQVCY